MSRASIFSIVLGVVSIGSHATVAKSEVVWSMNAMACETAGAPIATNLHDSLAGMVRFKEGRTGNVALICPISSSLNGEQLRSLRLTYRDGDGRQGPASASAVIRRVQRSDGHVASLPNGNVSSNGDGAVNSGPEGWATHQSGSAGNVLNHVLDLDNFYYYVQINMIRDDAAVPLAVMGVYLIN